jgi:hypothetical protein
MKFLSICIRLCLYLSLSLCLYLYLHLPSPYPLSHANPITPYPTNEILKPRWGIDSMTCRVKVHAMVMIMTTTTGRPDHDSTPP